jgi:hypothetical protein
MFSAMRSFAAVRAPRPHRHLVAAFALSALLAFQAVGWFLAWGIQQSGAWHDAQRALSSPETPFREITLHHADIQKIKVGRKEIRLEGRLFDIRCAEKIGDSLRLSLYHDAAEEALLDALGQLLQPGGGSKAASAPPLARWLAQWLHAAYLLPRPPVLVHFEPPTARAHFGAPAPWKAQAAPSIFAPPPEG